MAEEMPTDVTIDTKTVENTEIKIKFGSVLGMRPSGKDDVLAIVNDTDVNFINGGVLNEEITQKGGIHLIQQRKRLQSEFQKGKESDVRLTENFNTTFSKANFIIHAASPKLNVKSENKLENKKMMVIDTYKNIFKKAMDNKVTSIACCLISDDDRCRGEVPLHELIDLAQKGIKQGVYDTLKRAYVYILPTQKITVPIPNSEKEGFVQFEVVHGDILHFTNEHLKKHGAIVNAANTGFKGGAGLDGLINDAGGPPLQQARYLLKPGQPGDVRITESGNLQKYVKYIIHAAGPDFSINVGKKGIDILEMAYKNAMNIAKEHGVTHIRFPIISGGIYAGKMTFYQLVMLACEFIEKFAYYGLEEVKLYIYKAPSDHRIKQPPPRPLTYRRPTSTPASSKPPPSPLTPRRPASTPTSSISASALLRTPNISSILVSLFNAV